QISQFLTRNNLLGWKSVYISTSDGKVIAHSGASVVLPDSAAGDKAVRFRTIAELSGVEGAAGKRTSALPGARPASAWEEEADGQHYLVAVAQMSNIDWPWQLVVTVPKTRQLEPASKTTIILIGVIGLATLFGCVIGYAISRTIGGPLTKLLTNAQLARNGNIELMADVNSGSHEIDKINGILREFATERRRRVPLAKTESASEELSNNIR